jgi:murein DD-endopeptidase MepM/ murein hydrolase activator NlpD
MLRHRRLALVLAAAGAAALAALGLVVATGIGRDSGPPPAARDAVPPLPRFHPRAVEPVAGQAAEVAPGPPDATDVPRHGSGHRVSAGAPTDAQVREELEALQREQSRIERTILDSSAPIRQGSGRFIWPVFGPITSPFCERRSWEACHPGIDIGVPAGTAIRAADTGQVVLARPQGGYGNLTCIAHTASLSTCYAHQSRILVSPGQVVMRGQVIGAVGCTGLCFGPHLHFEVRIQGRVVNPMAYL